MTDHSTEIARLESIGRERALTMAESVQLENLIYLGRPCMKKRSRPKTAKLIVPDKPPCTRRFDASGDAWRINAEFANIQFVEALYRYFKRGGRA